MEHTKWFISHSPTTRKFMGRGLGFGRWYKSIKNQSTIGGTIIANAYGDTKEEAEAIAILISEVPEIKAKLKQTEKKNGELVKALKSALPYLPTGNKPLQMGFIGQEAELIIKNNEND